MVVVRNNGLTEHDGDPGVLRKELAQFAKYAAAGFE
jgi:hypothetical protein